MGAAFDPVDVLIVGAGLSGIGMAAHLRQALPGKSLRILEARERTGGTWDLFRYPGVRSDSDMFTLGYAFAPWTGARTIATGGEIREYINKVSEEYRINRDILTRRKVTSAAWDSAACLWSANVDGPEGPEVHKARFLFIAAGYYDYARPHDAALPGLEHFGGEVLHPQFWPEDFTAQGKRIAVIGSGATAVTLVPALTKAGAEHVTMIQRTPSWYYSQPAVDPVARTLQAVLPGRWAYGLIRRRNQWLHDYFFRRARREPEAIGNWLQSRVRSALGHAFDSDAFSPPYGPWQQRLCFVPDGDFFAALRSGRADIVTGEISDIGPGEIRMSDGMAVHADVLVTATGLRLAPMGRIALAVDGRNVALPDHWHYRDCMLSDVPNFAALTGYLNTAWTGRIDLVCQWLCKLFAQMDHWQADVVVPRLPDGAEPERDDGLAGFSSGYLQRARDLMPRNAVSGPWRLSHDFLDDRRRLRETPIDDGNLAFFRAGHRMTGTGPVARRRQLP